MGSDALVIGAGPSGLLAAKEIASKGFSVKILEEHARVGVPSHCAGLISVEGLKRIGVEATGEFVQNEVYGGRIYSPDGQCIEIRDRRPRAHVVDRAALDQRLADKALDAGAELVLGRRAERLTLADGSVIGASGAGWSEEARIVVDAEGPSRRLAAEAGLAGSRRKPLLGVNAEVACEIDTTMVEVWFGAETAPGFYAWVIPTSERLVRVGLAAREGDPTALLDGFIGRRFGSASHSPPRAGQVLVDGPVERTSSSGILLVGDAAGHVKPTTGGGVVLGGLCAIEAGKVTTHALEAGDTSASFLAGYDEAWRRLYGPEFRSMQTLRGLADRVSDERMNRFFDAFTKAGLGEVAAGLVAGGDMDMQDGVIRRALSEPRLMKAAISGLGRLALAELRGLVNL
ncbi:MAG: NAD(P)/FAD-dependent oxidoreductase [Candidatus Bathyarchaeota archaeon]|nr:NAD(P)/FAD-dependent oxidoreductase [Candidatus Bathyarchaeota archaeon]